MTNDDRDILFSPIRIGHREARNRLVEAPTTCGLGADGFVTDRDIAFMERRARGGVGTIINGAFDVHPTSLRGYGDLGGWGDEFVPGMRRLVEAVKAHDVVYIAQIAHTGNMWDTYASRLPTLSATASTGFPVKVEMAHEMDEDEIRMIVQCYGEAARRCREAGFDGVEIHGSHSTLVQQFLSPYCNKRTDRYGGPIENRLRFLFEIMDAVRARVGRDFILGVRLSAAEFVPGGLTVEDTVEYIPMLEAKGQLDYFNISVGGFGAIETIHPTSHFELSPFVDCAAAVKKVTKLPVIAVGKIKEQGGQILREGKADLVAFCRPLIADPDLPLKMQSGRDDEIRSCLCCNECHGRIMLNLRMGCTYNPEAGYETEGPLKAAEVRKKVVVIGGGPAGCEAARVAAERGHDVILLEKDDTLGGRIQLAAFQPGRQDMALIPVYYATQLDKLNVDVRLDTKATLELVASLEPDAVIVATGTNLVPPDLPGGSAAHVHQMDDVVREHPELGSKVVVYDTQFHVAPLATAELIASWGKDVELITPVDMLGREVEVNGRTVCERRLTLAGVKMTTNCELKEIRADSVVIRNRYSGADRVIEGVTAVVLCLPGEANDGLYRALKGKVRELHLVGDAYSPRRILAGVRDAYVAARSI